MGLFATDGLLIGTIVPFLFVLTLVVFIHELGHYLVGKWCGIGAKVFSVGFGPEIVGFSDKSGTRWRLSAIPLGGYVKFTGDMNAASATEVEQANLDLSEEDRRKAFHNKSVPKRAATVFAGPFANYLLAIVILTSIFIGYGRVIYSPTVGEVAEGSAAAAAGLQPGDVFLTLDGDPVKSFSDVQRYISPRAEVPITLEVGREGKTVTAQITPKRLETEDQFGNKMEHGVIGVSTDLETGDRRVVEFGPIDAFLEANREIWFVVKRTGGYLGGVIAGREKADQIGGPIRIATVSGQVATLGLIPLLNLAAILSISIGLLNLLPIPVLDGGHLMFYAYEAMTGKPLTPRVQEIGFRIGFALLLGFMVFATWNDLVLLFDRS